VIKSDTIKTKIPITEGIKYAASRLNLSARMMERPLGITPPTA